MSQTESQLLKFQITGYDKSHPDTYMLGLGTIDDENRFTGNLKHERSSRDLTKEADYNANSDPSCAWIYASFNGYGSVSYYYFTVMVTSLPITNISLVKDENVDPRPQTLDIEKAQAINADLLAALKSIQWSYNQYSVCPKCERETKDGHTATCIIGNAIAKAKGL